MYNLSEEQKKSLRWIIDKIRSGALGEVFDCVFLSTGKCARFQGIGSNITEDIPLTEGILQSFQASGLIFIEKKEKTVWRCGILGNKAYSAIESNFQEIVTTDVTPISTYTIEKDKGITEKSLIIYQNLLHLVDDSPLSKTLPIALRLAHEINHTDFEKWIRLEIGGYFNSNSALTNDVKVPTYRNVAGQQLDRFERPVLIPSKLQFLNSIPLRNGIEELEKLVSKADMLIIQDSVSIEFINENFGTEIYAFRFSPFEINGILSSIKLKLHDWMFEIGDLHPELSKPVQKKIGLQNMQSNRDQIWKVIVSLIVLGFALAGFIWLPFTSAILWLIFFIVAYPVALAFTTAKQSMDNHSLIEIYKAGLKQVPLISKLFRTKPPS